MRTFEPSEAETDRRAARIARLRRLARVLDTAFVLPGTKVRFGADALVGLVPGIGDAVTLLFSLWLIREARALGAPVFLVSRMIGNAALDAGLGAVPLVGDLFDVVWRANRRNLRLLEEWLARHG